MLRHGDRKFVTSLGGGFITKDQLWSKEKRDLARQRQQQLATLKRGTADKSSTPQKEPLQDHSKKMQKSASESVIPTLTGDKEQPFERVSSAIGGAGLRKTIVVNVQVPQALRTSSATTPIV